MKKEYAQYLIEKTIRDYNLIAEDFSSKRKFLSEDIKRLVEYTKEEEKVLDFGCGNGRLFELFKEKSIEYFGIDVAEKLIEIAKRNYFYFSNNLEKEKLKAKAEFRVVNGLNLPFPSNFFDKVYCLSVLHHIPSKEFRFQTLKEIKRILKPNGVLILRVWDFWKKKEGWKLIVKYGLLKLIGRSKLDFKDIFFPWKENQKKILVERYFHCFSKRELECLIKEVGFKIKKSWREGKDPAVNLYLIAEK